ncbi:MAG: hypothetical protein HN402_07870 [Candidatus Scalindua sp.]|jgi:hypothetical protein|nr:hypothetical protein [Candidatus Scalindua sp.]MBT6757773.1 hypothetical protein [Candidatus Jacksonbacteria bacterium]
MKHTITKDEMKSKKALADINLKVSEARNELFEMQAEEAVYIEEREKRVVAKIKKAVQDSEAMVKEAESNHGDIKVLANGLSDFADNLNQIHAGFNEMYEEFNKRNDAWEKDLNNQQAKIEQTRKEYGIVKDKLENDKKSLKRSQRKLAADKVKLESQRQSLKLAYDEIKNKSI